MVNTCGFIDAAKKDSIDTLLEAADLKAGDRRRPWSPSAAWPSGTAPSWPRELPEADAVLGFDDYADIADRLRCDHGRRTPPGSHVPRDRRTLLPLAPAERPAAVGGDRRAGARRLPWGSPRRAGPQVLRRRLDAWRRSAPLKIASGCDRRCAFCAIPSFRGSYLSRPVDDIVAEARWLVEHRASRRSFLVSRTPPPTARTSATPVALERLLARLDAVDGLDWIRVSATCSRPRSGPG